MRRVMILVCVAAALCGPATGEYGRVTGNGRLTVGVDAQGDLRVCRWPSPGYYTQCFQSCETERNAGGPNAPHKGGYFLVRLKNATGRKGWHGVEQRLPSPEQAGLDTVLRYANEKGRLRKTVLVCANADVVAVQLEWTGADAPESVCWYQDFDPRTVCAPGLAAGEAELTEASDFAVFTRSGKEGRVYHVRPSRPGMSDYARARTLAAADAPWEDWAEFLGRRGEEDGDVWIGLASANPVLGVSCGPDTGLDSPWTQARAGHPAAGGSCAAGHVASCVELTPNAEEGVWRATVFLAFGRTMDAVDHLLDMAAGLGFDALRQEANEDVQEWLGRFSGRAAADWKRPARLLLALRHATDAVSGGIAACPAGNSAEAAVSARVSAWTSHALDRAGYSDLAAAQLRFFLRAASASSADLPPGALAAAYYPDGTPALPSFAVDADGTGWFLSAVWRHGAELTDRERKAWYEEAWEGVLRSGNFLSGWTQQPGGRPLPSYDIAQGRDRVSGWAELYQWMGLRAGARIADALGCEEGEAWRQRASELENRLRFESMFGRLYRSQVGEALAYWLEGMTDEGQEAFWLEGRSAEARPAETTMEAQEGSLGVALRYLEWEIGRKTGAP